MQMSIGTEDSGGRCVGILELRYMLRLEQISRLELHVQLPNLREASATEARSNQWEGKAKKTTKRKLWDRWRL